jgi:hypothetical protein
LGDDFESAGAGFEGISRRFLEGESDEKVIKSGKSEA